MKGPKNEEVHVWKVSADSLLNQHVSILSEEEKTRAKRFRFQLDKSTYLLGKVLIRSVLGKYFHTDPSDLSFKSNQQGKPHLPDQPFRFNLSHTRGELVLAVSTIEHVGIDIEYNQKAVEVNRIANQFFTPDEINDLRSLDGASQQIGFYNAWTRKESFIKAVGGGLSIPLKDFSVTLIPGEKPAFRAISYPDYKVENWSLTEIQHRPEFTCCLCVSHPSPIVKEFDWTANTMIDAF